MNTTLDDRNTIRFNPKKLNFLKLFENKFGKINKWNNLKNKYHRSTIIKLGHEVTGSKSFQKLYHLLIKSLPLNFNKEIYHQKVPTFRLGLPNERATEFHTDNISSGHGSHIINFWIPLITLNKFNCLWLVDENWTKKIITKFRQKQLSINQLDNLSLKYAKPMIMEYGEVLKFSNSNIHGSVQNVSNTTRLSFDFRVLNGDKNSGIKNIDEAFSKFDNLKNKKKKFTDIVSVVFSNYEVKHISHSSQRKIINEYCETKKFKVLYEAAEWYNINHYPLLEEVMNKFPKKEIVLFSMKSFDRKKKITKMLFKKLKKHKAKVHFALENLILK